jgi:hypothetical protein
MMRTYDPRRAKSNRSYTLLQIAELFDIHIATVRAWVKAGLPLIDSQRPFMVHGLVLRQWLSERQDARKWPKAPDTLPCFTCSAPRRIKAGTFNIKSSNTDKIRVEGQCEICGKVIGRGDVRANMARLERQFETTPCED